MKTDSFYDRDGGQTRGGAGRRVAVWVVGLVLVAVTVVAFLVVRAHREASGVPVQSEQDDSDLAGYVDLDYDAGGMPNPEVMRDQDGVFLVCTEPPEFPDGTAAFLNYVRESQVYPKDALRDKVQGRVLVQFIVNEDGSISDVKVVKGLTPSLDAEAIRIVSAMPKWKPGKNDGQLCRVRYTVPVRFRLDLASEENK